MFFPACPRPWALGMEHVPYTNTSSPVPAQLLLRILLETQPGWSSPLRCAVPATLLA